jgi:hypothetical protein
MVFRVESLGYLQEWPDLSPQMKNTWATLLFCGPAVPIKIPVKTDQSNSAPSIRILSSPYPFTSNCFITFIHICWTIV